MATVIAKIYPIPAIAHVRQTVVGTQYTVETPESIDIVTVNGTHTSCTYHEANCSHIRGVQLRRIAYETLFDLSYGDIVA